MTNLFIYFEAGKRHSCEDASDVRPSYFESIRSVTKKCDFHLLQKHLLLLFDSVPEAGEFADSKIVQPR